MFDYAMAIDMAGFIPQTHQRAVAGAPYTVETSTHARDISIAVTVPGTDPEEVHNRVYMTEAETLGAADDIARILTPPCVNLGSINCTIRINPLRKHRA